MPLTIRYTDTRHTHEATCDDIQSAVIIRIVKAYMLYPADFNLMHIDLSDECCEEVHCWQVGDPGRRVCSFGGAIAWNIYCQTSEIWPEINYHNARPVTFPH